MLDFIWGGLGPNRTTQDSRNTGQNGCESRAPIPNYYSPYSPITQTNLRNQGQNAQCFHRESLLGSIFGGNIFSPPPPRENTSQSLQRNNDPIVIKNQKIVTNEDVNPLSANEAPAFQIYISQNETPGAFKIYSSQEAICGKQLSDTSNRKTVRFHV